MDKITVIHSAFGRAPKPFPDLANLSIDGDGNQSPTDTDHDSDKHSANSSESYIVHTSQMFEPEGWFLGREYHVVTRGIAVGIFHELSELRRSIDSVPTALFTTFKTWQQAIALWDNAREGGDITLLPEEARKRLKFPAPPPRLSPSFSPSPTPMQRTTRTIPAITRSATASVIAQGVAAAPEPPASPIYVSSAAPTPFRRIEAAAVDPGQPASPIYVSSTAPTPARRRVVAALPVRRAKLTAPVRCPLPAVPTVNPPALCGMPPFVRPPGWPTLTQRALWTIPIPDDPFSHYWHTPGGTEGAANHDYHWASQNDTQARQPTGTPRRFDNMLRPRTQARADSARVLVPDTPPLGPTRGGPVSLFPTPKKQQGPVIVISDSDSEVEATEPKPIKKYIDCYKMIEDANGKTVIIQTYDAINDIYFTNSIPSTPLETIPAPAPVASNSGSQPRTALAPVASGSGSPALTAIAPVASGSGSQALAAIAPVASGTGTPFLPTLASVASGIRSQSLPAYAVTFKFVTARAFEKSRVA